MFHMSMLWKYIEDPKHVLRHEALDLEPDLSMEERLVKILEMQEQRLQDRIITLIKVQREHHGPNKAMWEHESRMREIYLDLYGKCYG